MPDAAQHPAQPELPSPYQPGKRRGRARRSHTVARSCWRRADAGHGQRPVGGLPLPPPQRQPQRRRRLRPARATGRTRSRSRARSSRINILVMGSDSRDCEGYDIDSEAGGGLGHHDPVPPLGGPGVGVRHLHPARLLVDRPECKSEDGDTIPGGTSVMWNAAFSFGGPACTIQQFEQITGVRIDNYVVVDFGGFQDMVDAVDGVEVCVPEDIDRLRVRHHHPGRHPDAERQGGARLRAGAPRRRRRQRHRPDQAAAGVHRRDGRAR